MIKKGHTKPWPTFYARVNPFYKSTDPIRPDMIWEELSDKLLFDTYSVFQQPSTKIHFTWAYSRRVEVQLNAVVFIFTCTVHTWLLWPLILWCKFDIFYSFSYCMTVWLADNVLYNISYLKFFLSGFCTITVISL